MQDPIILPAGHVRRGATFVASLDYRDLTRLREITRSAWMKAGGGYLDTNSVDALIEKMGPESAEAALSDAIRKKEVQTIV